MWMPDARRPMASLGHKELMLEQHLFATTFNETAPAELSVYSTNESGQ